MPWTPLAPYRRPKMLPLSETIEVKDCVTFELTDGDDESTRLGIIHTIRTGENGTIALVVFQQRDGSWYEVALPACKMSMQLGGAHYYETVNLNDCCKCDVTIVSGNPFVSNVQKPASWITVKPDKEQ